MTPSELYADVRARVTELVRGLDPDGLAARVPGCPGWTVQEVVAHLAGVVTDVVAGNVAGAGSDEWTARQVAEREGRSLDDLIAEWTGQSALMESGLDAAPKAVSRTLLVDLVTHEHDIRGAVGIPGGTDSEAYAIARKGYHVGLAKVIEERGMPGLRLTAPDGWEFDAGPAPAAASVAAPRSYDLFRALSGRRSRGQVLAYDWEGDPEPYLEVFSRFGPLPENDVIEAV